jgi:hypothetical protein
VCVAVEEREYSGRLRNLHERPRRASLIPACDIRRLQSSPHRRAAAVGCSGDRGHCDPRHHAAAHVPTRPSQDDRRCSTKYVLVAACQLRIRRAELTLEHGCVAACRDSAIALSPQRMEAVIVLCANGHVKEAVRQAEYIASILLCYQAHCSVLFCSVLFW